MRKKSSTVKRFPEEIALPLKECPFRNEPSRAIEHARQTLWGIAVSSVSAAPSAHVEWCSHVRGMVDSHRGIASIEKLTRSSSFVSPEDLSRTESMVFC